MASGPCLFPGCTAHAAYQMEPDFGILPAPEVWRFCAVHVQEGIAAALDHQRRRGDPFISIIVEPAWRAIA
jgi:hypothetical protein